MEDEVKFPGMELWSGIYFELNGVRAIAGAIYIEERVNDRERIIEAIIVVNNISLLEYTKFQENLPLGDNGIPIDELPALVVEKGGKIIQEVKLSWYAEKGRKKNEKNWESDLRLARALNSKALLSFLKNNF